MEDEPFSFRNDRAITEIMNTYCPPTCKYFDFPIIEGLENIGVNSCNKKDLTIVNNDDDKINVYKSDGVATNQISRFVPNNIIQDPIASLSHIYKIPTFFVNKDSIYSSSGSQSRTILRGNGSEEYEPKIEGIIYTSLGDTGDIIHPLSFYLNYISVDLKDSRLISNIIGISLLQAIIKYKVLETIEKQIIIEKQITNVKTSVSDMASLFHINKQIHCSGTKYKDYLRFKSSKCDKDYNFDEFITINLKNQTESISYLSDYLCISNESQSPMIQLFSGPKKVNYDFDSIISELVNKIIGDSSEFNRYKQMVINILKIIDPALSIDEINISLGGYPRKIRNPKTGRLVKSTGEKGLDVRKKKEIGKKISEGMKRSASKKRASSTDSRKKAPAKKAPAKAKSTKKPASAKKPVKKSAKKPAAKKPVKKSWGLF